MFYSKSVSFSEGKRKIHVNQVSTFTLKKLTFQSENMLNTPMNLRKYMMYFFVVDEILGKINPLLK